MLGFYEWSVVALVQDCAMEGSGSGGRSGAVDTADAGYLPQSNNLKRADVVIFSLSTAIIMHCYSQEREVFRSKYLNVLDWVFGIPPPPCETPRCKNS